MSLLAELMHPAWPGDHPLTVISGSAGVGKTRLLSTFAMRAIRAGVVVLQAMGLRHGPRSDYEAIREMLAGHGEYLPERTGAEAGPDGWPAVAEHLNRAITRLGENRRVVLLVDDAEYLDALSLRCLQHLLHRRPDNAVALVFTWDPHWGNPAETALQELIYQPDARRIQLEPLSRTGVVRMVAERLECAQVGPLATEYHSWTGGLPLLVNALLADRFGHVEDCSAHGPEGPAPITDPYQCSSTFRQAAMTLLRRMGPVAQQVARCLALFGETADAQLVSRLSDIGLSTVLATVQKLASIGLIAGWQFRHEMARVAVLEELGTDETARLRQRAARVLHDDGAPATAIADQLLVAGPVIEPWVAPVLQDAARLALAAHDVPRAISCLKLADTSCAEDSRRYAVKIQLAELHRLIDPAPATARFRSLKAPALDGRLTVAEGYAVALGLLSGLQVDDAAEVISRTIDRESDVDGDMARQVLAVQIAASYPGVAARLPLPGAIRGSKPAPLRAAQALLDVLTHNADAHTIAQAEQVLQNDNVVDGSLAAVVPAIHALVYASGLDAAYSWAKRLEADAVACGAPGRRSTAQGLQALVSLRRGYLDVAAEQAESALAGIPDQDYDVDAELTRATLAEAYTSIGDLEQAARLFARPVRPGLLQTRAGLHFLYARGLHHLAEQRGYAALADFLACGEQMQQWDIDHPALVPWRIGAAEAWLSLDERENAVRLVEEQLTQSGLGLSRVHGMTLRCLAATRRPDDRTPILEKALRMLQLSGDRYETARVLADLSVVYQHQGDKTKARTTALRARRIAKSCHAEALSQALMPTVGASRPLRDDPAGEEAGFAKLSGSERRVAALAAQGYTNREISAKLFVTVSTIEQHLTRVYRKLDVRNREELSTELRVEAA